MVGEDERRWARAREPSEATRNASSSRSCSRRATFPQGGPGGGADAHGAAAAAVSGMRLGRVPLGPDPTPSSTPLRPVKPVFKPIFAEGGRVIDPSSTPLEWRLSLCSSQFSARAADSLLGSKESRVGGWGLTAHPAPPGGPGALADAHGAGAAAPCVRVCREAVRCDETQPLARPPCAPRAQCSSRSSPKGVELSRPPCAPRGQCSSRSSSRGVELRPPFDPPRVAAIPVYKPDPAEFGRFPFRVERDACWLDMPDSGGQGGRRAFAHVARPGMARPCRLATCCHCGDHRRGSAQRGQARRHVVSIG